MFPLQSLCLAKPVMHLYLPSVPAHPLSLASTVLEWVRGTSFTCQAVKTAASCVDTSQMSQLKRLTERVAIKGCTLADVLMEDTELPILGGIGSWRMVLKNKILTVQSGGFTF